ncbi:DUF6496 domain-containing protein [Aurantimonas sp. MSK8Z-1]|uniref:DUF6496 domain-containing protein n=1 Tax=Mangrovibrevibacter kandeliae TaxID=2968473 RepID=UPI0021182840|nr:DUF6496 domain-containing protein [Aurantimonas sp. MSK8Z-1]MCW4116076.1 DUF6496 domain-containing protein [Aurantimonas sp. MSK8Z-1]
MAKAQSDEQQATVARVMHKFKDGELKIGGNGLKVKSRKQAVAIALEEAGSSNRESSDTKQKALRRTKAKEEKGETAEAEAEGKAAQDRTLRKHGASSGSSPAGGKTRDELYAEAQKRGIEGRSKMSKQELKQALRT